MTASPDDAATSARTDGAQPRLASVDLLRGVVMIVMALDHAREFFSEAHFDPTDLGRTSAALFATRWITHFCAPVFMLLAGTAAYLSLHRGRNRAGLSRFLVTRGLWLMLLELVVVKLVSENLLFDRHVLGLQVIWALGGGMVVLAALVQLPMRALVAIGAALVFGHNLLDGVVPATLGALETPWRLLLVVGWLPGIEAANHAGLRVFVAYPLLPWLGVMVLGFALGAWLEGEARTRRRRLSALGCGLIALFVVLRATNLFGDPSPWQTQDSPLFTLFSFVNTTKYPPSLLFLAMTLGPALLALVAFEHWHGRSAAFVRIYGRVPLFYYVLHLLLLSTAALLARWIVDGQVGPAPLQGGWNLPVVYAAWIGVVLALYQPCRAFAALKEHRRDAWLGYL